MLLFRIGQKNEEDLSSDDEKKISERAQWKLIHKQLHSTMPKEVVLNQIPIKDLKKACDDREFNGYSETQFSRVTCPLQRGALLMECLYYPSISIDYIPLLLSHYYAERDIPPPSSVIGN